MTIGVNSTIELGDIGDKLFVIEILAVFATILHFVLLVIYKNCFT